MRRGGRVVECAALEMQYTGNRIEGSNPSLSAINSPKGLKRKRALQKMVLRAMSCPILCIVCALKALTVTGGT